MGALLSETSTPRRAAAPQTVERTLAEPAPIDPPWRLDAGLLAGVGCLLLALLVGVLIGRSGGSGDDTKAAAPRS